MEPQKPHDPKFSDYLYILFKWKKFLIINMIIVTAIATTIAFLIPKTYRATAVIMIPPDNTMGLGGITSLLSNKSSAVSLGSKLFGISSTSEDLLLGILNSRTALTNVIQKYNLMEYYGIDDNNMDKAIKAFSGDLSFDPNEYGMIEIRVVNESPEMSAEIANYFVKLLDSTNISLNIEQAKNNREFIEKRYHKNLEDLKLAEESLFKFQKKYGIFAVPEQLEVAVKAAAEIEAQLIGKEISGHFIKELFGENTPQYQSVLSEINLLRAKVIELKNADKLSSVSNVFFPFKEAPDISINYLRNYRELEIQSKILEVILPLYEQAKVEEQKSIPTVQVIDPAVPPELKYGPKRAFIILAFVSVLFFILVPLTFRMEKQSKMREHHNPLVKKENSFYSWVKKVYRIKI